MTARSSAQAYLGPACVMLAGLMLTTACSMSARDTTREWERYGVEVEGGGIWQGNNDVGVPGTTGTRFSMAQLVGRGPDAYARLGLGYSFNPVHDLRFVWAPLSMSGTGALDQTTQFAGQTFAAGVPTTARYRLDSYQLTWRARVHEDETWDWHAGLSGRYVDGGADLSQAGLAANYSDGGFLPLLHLDGRARLSQNWSAVFDADAGGVSQRRMLDFTLQLRTFLDEDWELGVGYRGIQAWFESPEAFNQPWLHAALVSLSYRF